MSIQLLKPFNGTQNSGMAHSPRREGVQILVSHSEISFPELLERRRSEDSCLFIPSDADGTSEGVAENTFLFVMWELPTGSEGIS